VNTTAPATDTRVLVLTPTAKDYALLETIFARHGIEGLSCRDLACVCIELERGAGALLIAEEALASSAALVDWLHAQPPWSDLPILVLARPGNDSSAVAAATDRLGNVTILDRPTRVASLLSAVRSALRARNRQYQIREHLADQKLTHEQLRANDRRKDEFLAILAHELRNPLAPLTNALHILNRKYEDHPETAHVRQVMERQLSSMKRLVDDLLEVSRVTRGRLEMRFEHVDLATIVKSAVEVSEPLIAAARHRLEVVLPEVPVYVHADVVRLAQVIANLLNNAAKYTRADGVIRLTVTADAREVAISIADDGVGIPLELQPQIFEMFMQVEGSRNRAQGGLGIGLTLVKTLVELHEGRVEVFSEGLGKGSCFTVRLPVREPAGALESDGRANTVADLAGVNVLIADDNRDAADTLAEVLRKCGARVQVAYGGAEALTVMNPAETDAAILDIGMPDLNGIEVARHTRARDGGMHPVLIALTGWGQRQDQLDTKNAGFDHHLTKPVDIPHIVTLLKGARPRLGCPG
jgi:signal transduction histidine kinase/CheY-like chemotaxis protein